MSYTQVHVYLGLLYRFDGVQCNIDRCHQIYACSAYLKFLHPLGKQTLSVRQGEIECGKGVINQQLSIIVGVAINFL